MECCKVWGNGWLFSWEWILNWWNTTNKSLNYRPSQTTFPIDFFACLFHRFDYVDQETWSKSLENFWNFSLGIKLRTFDVMCVRGLVTIIHELLMIMRLRYFSQSMSSKVYKLIFIIASNHWSATERRHLWKIFESLGITLGWQIFTWKNWITVSFSVFPDRSWIVRKSEAIITKSTALGTLSWFCMDVWNREVCDSSKTPKLAQDN